MTKVPKIEPTYKLRCERERNVKKKIAILSTIIIMTLCVSPLCMVNGKENEEACYLCGEAEQSMMSLYSKYDTIGVIDLQTWNVLDLRLKTYDEDGNEILENSGNDTVFGNTNAIQYVIDSIPARGVAEAEFTFRENGINTELLQNHLCQTCHEKVMETVNTDKETVPLCVVDFETKEVYSLQMQKGSYFIRDYRIKVEREESEVYMQAYYLPKRSVK